MSPIIVSLAPVGAFAAVLAVATMVHASIADARSVPTQPATPRHQRLHRRRPPPTAEQWAALLDAVSAEVRTGSSLTVAHRHALTAHPWCDLPSGDHDDEHAALVRHTLHSIRTLGGPGAVGLDAAASLLRERAALRAEVAVHSAQARLSARVMTTVPVAFCAWSLASSASFRRAWLSPIGLVCALCGGLCNLCGWWWMRYSIGRVER